MDSRALLNFLKVLFFLTFLFFIFYLSNNNYMDLNIFNNIENGKKFFNSHKLPDFDDTSWAGKREFNKKTWFFDLFIYLNAIYFGLNNFKYYKIFILFISFFIIFLIIYKRQQGKYISISLPFAVLASYIILSNIKVSPDIFDIFFISCFLYVLERIPSKRNKTLYYFLPFLSLFWININANTGIYGFIIWLIYLLYRYMDLKEQPEKEEKYSFKILILTGAGIILAILINPYFRNVLEISLKFITDKSYLLNFNFKNLNIILFCFYLFLYFIILEINLKGADVGRRAEFIKDVFLTLFFLFLVFKKAKFIPHFLVITIPVFSYYVYLIFKWDFVWEKKWTEKTLIRIRNMIYMILIPLIFILIFIEGKFTKSKNYPYNIINYINSENVPANIYNPKEIGSFLSFYLYPQYKIFIDTKDNGIKNVLEINKGIENNLKDTIAKYDINTFILSKEAKIISELLKQGFKISYFDDEYYILVNSLKSNKYFKNIDPLQAKVINKYEDAILELENFESNYASQEAALLLAKIYAEKDLSKAIKYLENKVYEYSDNSLLCNYLGKLFYRVEDYENAYETWKKSKQKDEEVKKLMLKIKNKI